MMKLKGKENMERIHVNQTTPVKAVDAKLGPLEQRYEELRARVTRFRGILTPNLEVHGTEREMLQAKIELAQAMIDLTKFELEIGELQTERARVVKIEVERTERALDREEEEILQVLDAVYGEAEALNLKLYNVEQARGRLGCHPVIDLKIWPEFMPASAEWTPRVHEWRQSLQQGGRLK